MAEQNSLVTADWMKDRLDDPAVRIFEVSVEPELYAGGTSRGR